ncbi:MAG TPA: hypothetical protein VKE94_08780 [Gemmataceae bacterium]|nr:hypothetical protein [Gemmataceae bacterium]
MRIATSLLGPALLAVSSAPAAAIDLNKIDRTIGKEPAYKSDPKYCLLVFGPEAKTRVWLVRDGNILYVDRNGDGDLTGPGARLAGEKRPDGIKWRVGDVREREAKTAHKDLLVWFHRGSYTVHLRTADGFHQDAGNEMGRLHFAARPEDAPIVHLAGPLTFLLAKTREKPLEFVPGKEEHFIVLIGTPGLGEGASAYGYSDDFGKPGAFKMIVEAEFPGGPGAALLRSRNVCADC